MKIALIQDQLLTPSGSERVFLYMAQEFREADLFSLCYNPKATWPEFEQLHVRTSALNYFIRDHSQFKLFFPLATYWMEYWDFSKYDLIITSSATTAKYIKKFSGKHICYCYFPTRAIWSYDSYFRMKRGILEKAFRLALDYFKARDRAAADRVNHFIAISQCSADAIRKYYGHAANVLFSPVDTYRFGRGITDNKADYFLLVSRLEEWKLIDYAIDAFNQLGLPLRIVGKGEDEARLRAMAGPTISFLGAVDDNSLVKAYGEARAVIFTPELEYGLVPLEANAAGTPVIALGRGGVLETMVDLDDQRHRRPTSVLFSDPTVECLKEAVVRFQAAHFSREDLVSHVAKFGIEEFQKRLREMVNEYLGFGQHEQS